MPHFAIPLAEIQSFLLVLVRVLSILLTAPIFSGQHIPGMVKVGLAVCAAAALTPLCTSGPAAFRLDPLVFSIGVVSEIAVGAAIGLISEFVFSGIQIAGQLIGFQMGFSIVNVMDPMTTYQVPVIAQIQYLAALLLFLITDAHHWFIRAIAESLKLIPPFGAHIGAGTSQHLVNLAGGMFVIGLKASAPVIVCLLLSTAALGLIARTVPQMNVFFVAMPAKIILGLAFLMFSIPFVALLFKTLFVQLEKDVWILLRTVS
jgi:flagellar biosynthesis protein FliR